MLLPLPSPFVVGSDIVLSHLSSPSLRSSSTTSRCCNGGISCGINDINATFLQAAAASPCNSHNFQWMIITFFVIHTVGFSGTIPFILNSELFPLQIRGSLAGVATAVNWACSALVSTAYAPFANLVYPYTVWWGFGIANLISTVCVAVFLPETKGVKLEEIEHFLQRRYRLCQWKQMNYN